MLILAFHSKYCCGWIFFFFFFATFPFSLSPSAIPFFFSLSSASCQLIIEAHFKHSISGKISVPLRHHIHHSFIHTQHIFFLSLLVIFIHVCTSKCEEARINGGKNKGIKKIYLLMPQQNSISKLVGQIFEFAFCINITVFRYLIVVKFSLAAGANGWLTQVITPVLPLQTG